MSERVLFVGSVRESFLEFEQSLRKESYALASVIDEAEAYVFLREEGASVVVAEESLPGGRGSDFLAEVQKRHPTCVRVMILGAGDRNALLDAVNRAEVFRLLARPFPPLVLARVLREALLLARVAEAQETVWRAAKDQREALARLGAVDGAPSVREVDERVTASRFAGRRVDGQTEPDRIGELSEEHALRLSTREREIVAALGAGRRVKDIAQDLVISTHTVRNHLKAIYRKLNVSSQFELIGMMARNSKDSSS